MMTILNYLFAFLLVVDCLFLTLLILVQLPKKDAGAGMAFGGGAADALFGAGSGTALTKLTKYCAIAFFLLVIGLSVIGSHGNGSNQQLRRAMDATSAAPPPAPAPAPTTPAPAALPTSSAPGLSLTIGSNSTPAAPTTPAAPAAATNNPPK